MTPYTLRTSVLAALPEATANTGLQTCDPSSEIEATSIRAVEAVHKPLPTFENGDVIATARYTQIVVPSVTNATKY